MKECERVCNLFGDLKERLLDSDTEGLVNEHLHSCAFCREDLKWYGFTIQALSNLETVPPPDDFVAQLRSKIYLTPQRSSSFQFVRNLFTFSPYLPLPVGVTTLAFVAVLGFFAYNNIPNPVVTTTEAMLSISDSSGHSSGAANMPVGGGTTSRPTDKSSLAGVFGKSVQSGPTPGSDPMPQYAMSAPRRIGEAGQIKAQSLPTPTVADVIGADNLTVESRSVDRAIDSVKRILPNIHGQLIGEIARDRVGEIVLGIRIPSSAYRHLTSELINHGAVAVGAGSDSLPPTRAAADGNNVDLYIRFVNSR